MEDAWPSFVRAVRTYRAWSQEELAFRINVDRSYVTRLESGKERMSTIVLGSILRELGPETLQQLIEQAQTAHSFLRVMPMSVAQGPANRGAVLSAAR